MHSYTHTHTRTHARTHTTHTFTRKITKSIICVSFYAWIWHTYWMGTLRKHKGRRVVQKWGYLARYMCILKTNTSKEKSSNRWQEIIQHCVRGECCADVQVVQKENATSLSQIVSLTDARKNDVHSFRVHANSKRRQERQIDQMYGSARPRTGQQNGIGVRIL